ncbi:MAG: glycosyltransferase family 2 protein [Alphaproteobacteria bacterium]
MPEICAAICTYARHDLLPLALDSVRGQTLDPDRYRILIIDNTGPTETGLTLQAEWDGVENIRYRIETMPGLSRARNRAVDLSGDCAFIAYLDDDAVAPPDWLSGILDGFASAGAKAGVVGGPVDPIWPCERPAWLADSLLTLLTVVDWGGAWRELGEKEWIAGTNIAFRREALVQTGGFSERLGRTGDFVLESNEEVDVIRTLKAQGWQAFWDPALRMRHRVHGDRIDQAWIRRRISWQAVSDFKSDPAACLARLGEREALLTRFLERMPGTLKGVGALHARLEDPLFFEIQVAANYAATILLLAGTPPAALREDLRKARFHGPRARLRAALKRARRLLRAPDAP